MKKLVMTAIVALTCVSAWAQGTVLFANYNTTPNPDILALTYDADGTTRLDGANGWRADLFYGSPGSDPSTWTAIGLNATYRSTAAAGRLTAVEVPVPGFVGGSQVGLSIRAWNIADGATWTVASTVPGAHVSAVTAPSVVVRLGDPLADPPGLPANLIDVNTSLALASHNLTIVPVPEPSTILLGLAGIGGLLFIRRKTA